MEATPQEIANKASLLAKVKSTMNKINRAEKGESPIDDPDLKNSDGDGKIPEASLDLGSAIEYALNDTASKKAAKEKDIKDKMKQKAADKRKETDAIKKQHGISDGKESKFPTRSDYFLKEPMRALNVVLNHKETEIYKDGADPCPRLLMGHSAYGKVCKRNAFEHFVNLQKKIRDYRGEAPENAPAWLIISNDTAMISDRNIITRLEEQRPTTGVVAAYGFEKIRSSGRWYDVTAPDQENIRGCYIQGSLENIEWDFVVGHEFKQRPRYRIVIAHGPFIAIRGPLFMSLDFTEQAEKYESGFYHYMAELSMECFKRDIPIASVKTTALQFDTLTNAKGTEAFEKDQLLFTSRWQKNLPAAIPALQVPRQR